MSMLTAARADTREDFAELDRGVRSFYRIGWIIVGLALLVVGFVAHQVVLTSWLAEANQPELLAAAELRFASVVVREVPYVPVSASPVPPSTDVTTAQVGEPEPRRGSLLVEAPPEKSEAFAIITVPGLARLSEGWTVVEGVGIADLKTGAGHMPSTPLPGMPGNAVISGHRTTYGAPFNALDQLAPGDVIEVETAAGVHSYVVRESIVVSPQDLWVTDPRDGAWLTLTTCNPEFSARERLVVFAELDGGPNWEAIYG